MKVLFNDQPITLQDSDLLGEGGEAKVYKYHNNALKIFHSAKSGTLEAHIRDQKINKLKQFPMLSSDRVISPLSLVKDAKKTVIGYAMRAVQGTDFAQLSTPRRRTLNVSNSRISVLFEDLRKTIQALHVNRVVVGDLNDGNVLSSGDQALLIDADSLQFDGWPCLVGHERFLDPSLYGVDLTKGVHFTEGTDWYSFAVMYFASLLCVHPYGGTHQKYNTLLRRAEARHSVFRSDVTLPRNAAPLKTLTDDALQWFSTVFEGKVRTEPPPQVMKAQWHVCKCGTEHARAVCPVCHVNGPVAARTLVRTRGRCTARTVFRTDGRILCTSIQGGLRYAFEEAGYLRREDGANVCTSIRGLRRVGISGGSTWCADDQGYVRQWLGGREIAQCQTSIRQGEPVLASSGSGALVQQQEWLVNASTKVRLGRTLENQTWLWSSDSMSLGFYRAGMFVHVFLLLPGQAGLRKIDDISFAGKVTEASAAFDGESALFTVVTELNGKETVSRWRINSSAKVTASSNDGPRGHAAMLHGRVVIATDAGLVLLRNDSGRLVEHLHFSDTQEFVAAGDELLPNSDGSLYVIGTREITQLTLM